MLATTIRESHSYDLLQTRKLTHRDRTQGISPSHRAEISGMQHNTLFLRNLSKSLPIWLQPSSLSHPLLLHSTLYSRNSDDVPFPKSVLSHPVHIYLTYCFTLSLPGKFQLQSSTEIAPISKVVIDVSFAGEQNYSLLCSPMPFFLALISTYHVELFVILNISIFQVAFLQNRSKNNVLLIF